VTMLLLVLVLLVCYMTEQDLAP